MSAIHTNDWGSFITDTIILDGGSGMVSLDYDKENEGVAFLHDLSVIPVARGKGLGERLLKAAITQAKKRDCKHIELTWSNESTPLWVFEWYERNGFEEVKIGHYKSLMRKEI